MTRTPPTVIAIVASHNRRDKTMECIRSYFALSGDYELSMVLVDDGSSDGTAEAASSLSDRVDVLRGDGSLFWAKAMAIAERRAVEHRPDYLLWLNDDVVLQHDALGTLMAAMGGNVRRIVVGSVVDPVSGDVTYGGLDRVDWHPLRYRHVAPTDGVPRPVTTISGNVVLVPRCVYSEVGGIDGGFSHGRADWDYGLRAKRLGIETDRHGPPCGNMPAGRVRRMARSGAAAAREDTALLRAQGLRAEVNGTVLATSWWARLADLLGGPYRLGLRVTSRSWRLRRA